MRSRRGYRKQTLSAKYFFLVFLAPELLPFYTAAQLIQQRGRWGLLDSKSILWWWRRRYGWYRQLPIELSSTTGFRTTATAVEVCSERLCPGGASVGDTRNISGWWGWSLQRLCLIRNDGRWQYSPLFLPRRLFRHGTIPTHTDRSYVFFWRYRVSYRLLRKPDTKVILLCKHAISDAVPKKYSRTGGPIEFNIEEFSSWIRYIYPEAQWKQLYLEFNLIYKDMNGSSRWWWGCEEGRNKDYHFTLQYQYQYQYQQKETLWRNTKDSAVASNCRLSHLSSSFWRARRKRQKPVPPLGYKFNMFSFYWEANSVER